ncbi:MAG: FAD-dependent oxidoreductase [Arenicellales bacterium]|jgi:glycine/D-amino acid oxidase-like deaminating enzyme|nr:FAD-dependent oxidoreductase [Arenicellales bacterium]
MGYSKSAVIIGAGVIGCAITLQMSRKGYRTINIDKNPEGRYGCVVPWKPLVASSSWVSVP